jgi:hypothetical protein
MTCIGPPQTARPLLQAFAVVFLAVNVNRYYLQVTDVAASPAEQDLVTILSWHFLTAPARVSGRCAGLQFRGRGHVPH